MMDEYRYGDQEERPGEPKFLYVGRISDEAREKALASAFAKAKSQALQLASAADAQLGKLSSLRGSAAQAELDSYGEFGYSRSAMMRMMMAQQAGLAGGDESNNEAIAPRPGMVSLQVMVQATFELK